MKLNSEELFVSKKVKVYHQNDDCLSIIITTNSERIEIIIIEKDLFPKTLTDKYVSKFFFSRKKVIILTKSFGSFLKIQIND